jgi:hypothetical protein
LSLNRSSAPARSRTWSATFGGEKTGFDATPYRSPKYGKRNDLRRFHRFHRIACFTPISPLLGQDFAPFGTGLLQKHCNKECLGSAKVRASGRDFVTPVGSPLLAAGVGAADNYP